MADGRDGPISCAARARMSNAVRFYDDRGGQYWLDVQSHVRILSIRIRGNDPILSCHDAMGSTSRKVGLYIRAVRSVPRKLNRLHSHNGACDLSLRGGRQRLVYEGVKLKCCLLVPC